MQSIPGVKQIIAVASGKGGVGKSMVSVNLALALQALGARVGLLDADIYGPSAPIMLGVNTKPESDDGKSINPVLAHGLQTMSIGYLLEEAKTPMVWRGPMVSMALQQMLNDTKWQAVDFLIIDLPPGTGDIQLTLAQKIPVTGAVIVTTPQALAVADARKAMEMFQKVNIPTFGIIENMSYHQCTHCGHEEQPFGAGGGAAMAEQYQVPLLGKVPLDLQIREHMDNGMPSLVSDPNGPIAEKFKNIATNLQNIITQQKAKTNKFPKIVIE